ncbi:MAG: hypothetical protein QXH27_05935 [Candidatus Micrarchaeia archaeon]
MNARFVFAITVLALLFLGCAAQQPPANVTAPPAGGATPAGVESLLAVDSEEPQMGAEELLLPTVESE